MSSREERIALNEAAFREVNERIEDLAESFDLKTQPLDFVCECGDANCMERLSMTRAEYEQLRSDALQFAVLSHTVTSCGTVEPARGSLLSRTRAPSGSSSGFLPKLVSTVTSPLRNATTLRL